ncbi:TetR/AcrR family transcriptional regulator [Sphaerisporangium fuscum]|uniref:TetR/AcrR family transcriptional regulator n=1 Tax=Sphaerisporangium fuscum TaxID=2835868 RepID=UPI001BDC9FA5|nr:TetR/AcrR family transcriptional regulator [Sphaerisporangium fuscum]
MATTRHSTTPPSDRRVRRTRSALARALIQLVEEQDLPRISVSDVAESAGVSRSAFYDHYRDVHELAEDACTAMIDHLIESLPAPTYGSPDLARQATESLTAFFASLAEHAGLYRALLGPQGSARVTDHIRGRFTDVILNHLDHADTDGPSRPVPHDITAAFTAGALIGVATHWLHHQGRRTAAQMAAQTWPLLSAYYHLDTHDDAGLFTGGVPRRPR